MEEAFKSFKFYNCYARIAVSMLETAVKQSNFHECDLKSLASSCLLHTVDRLKASFISALKNI